MASDPRRIRVELVSIECRVIWDEESTNRSGRGKAQPRKRHWHKWIMTSNAIELKDSNWMALGSWLSGRYPQMAAGFSIFIRKFQGASMRGVSTDAALTEMLGCSITLHKQYMHVRVSRWNLPENSTTLSSLQCHDIVLADEASQQLIYQV